MVVGQEPVPFFGKSKPDIYACLEHGEEDK